MHELKKIQGQERYDRERGKDHEHNLHRISSCHDSPLFVARNPLSEKQNHGYSSPVNAGFGRTLFNPIHSRRPQLAGMRRPLPTVASVAVARSAATAMGITSSAQFGCDPSTRWERGFCLQTSS
jgi:hypothetical protein